jgi:hypothetical protein
MARGNFSTAMGHGTTAEAHNSLAIGKYNKIDGDYLFSIGNGNDNNNRSNALTVDGDGNVTAKNFIFSGENEGDNSLLERIRNMEAKLNKLEPVIQAVDFASGTLKPKNLIPDIGVLTNKLDDNSKLVNSLTEQIGDVNNELSAVGINLIEPLKTTINEAKTSLNSVTDWINKVIGIINDAFDTVQGYAGDLIKLPDIPPLQQL